MGTVSPVIARSTRIKKSKRADAVFLGLLRQLLDTFEDQEEGVRKSLDSEYLHDLRIAVRRTRTLLAHANKTLPAHEVKYFAKEFRWLSDVTGSARDIDVQLLHFDELVQRLPKTQHDDLVPLHNYICERQRAEYRTLNEIMNSIRYRQLICKWRAFSTMTPRTSHKRSNAMRAIGDIAPTYVAEVWGKTEKQGRKLKPYAADNAFHDLRKTGKKLRYLLEFFKDVIPKISVKKIMRDLKHLLERLGSYQDYVVQKDFLVRCRADIVASQTDTTPLDRALKQLIAESVGDEVRLKRDCIIAWQQFSAYAERKCIKKLLRTSQHHRPKKIRLQK